MRFSLGILIVTMLAFVPSCKDDSPSGPDTGITAQNARTSECGGFAPSAKPAASDTSSTETLSWRYDAASKTLAFTNSHVSLNCCGKHSIDAFLDGSTIVISESDEPSENGRCKCICTFDFAIDVSGTFEQKTTVRLQRTVDDSVTVNKQFEINLSTISGSVVIQ